ncbi:hypothetical protein DERP_003285 [Dermatophagoides pteronyssinus]|uniref:Uncharacterized protein n=1 Tax=Dermatophagoides pteronyssinus TaxID=6956 RepID=A0ABQ8JJ29_DERPT|nr:hypothetical protein DERP_003285 [Dermatophagoides pteronyssinus]
MYDNQSIDICSNFDKEISGNFSLAERAIVTIVSIMVTPNVIRAGAAVISIQNEPQLTITNKAIGIKTSNNDCNIAINREYVPFQFQIESVVYQMDKDENQADDDHK